MHCQPACVLPAMQVLRISVAHDETTVAASEYGLASCTQKHAHFDDLPVSLLSECVNTAERSCKQMPEYVLALNYHW